MNEASEVFARQVSPAAAVSSANATLNAPPIIDLHRSTGTKFELADDVHFEYARTRGHYTYRPKSEATLQLERLHQLWP